MKAIVVGDNPSRMTTLSDKAAERGNPSFVWREGQARRLNMANDLAPMKNKRVLEFGCGVGVYMNAMKRFTPHVYGFDIEIERLIEAKHKGVERLAGAVGERLPFADESFDVVFSNDVLEHVQDDRESALEIVRVLRPSGRAVIFVPNRLYLFETHGIYWRGKYHFGNKPFVNWLPDSLRNKFAPHVRAYTSRGLLKLFEGAPTRLVKLTQINGGFDNIVRRFGGAGRLIRGAMQAAESTPLRVFGLEHLLVIEKQS
jgi:SAM-dependent methyltransferase